MAQETPYSHIGEQVLAIRNQANSLVTQCNVLLRQISPYVEQEAASQGSPSGRRVFGKIDKEE